MSACKKKKIFNFQQQIALPLRAVRFCCLRKIHSCSFIPNCTRNHVVTYTNMSEELKHGLKVVKRVQITNSARAVKVWL